MFSAARARAHRSSTPASWRRRFRPRTKRTLDVIAAGVLLLVCAPLLMLTAAAILLTMGLPIFFRQPRSGHRGRRFMVLKFRTMSNGPGPDAQRLTPAGRLIRAASLDELPQLWNVLKGEMSLVGPRPLLPQYDERYSVFQKRRLEAVPGITGWAQIHGRNSVPWERRFELDVWYVENQSLWLDLKILALTAARVWKREGISGHAHATMPEFQGHD